jgi:hypothetical protein
MRFLLDEDRLESALQHTACSRVPAAVPRKTDERMQGLPRASYGPITLATLIDPGLLSAYAVAMEDCHAE